MSDDSCELSGQQERDEVVIRWVLDGESLTAAEVENLEQSLKSNPDHLESRCRLIGNYFRDQFDPEVSRRRVAHLIWIHENHPDLEIVGMPFCAPTPDEPEAAARIAEIWNARVAAHPEDITVLAQAATYFRNSDEKTAGSLYETLKALQPENPAWYGALGHLLLLRVNHAIYQGGTDLPAAKWALHEFLAAEQRTPDKEGQFYLCNDVAWAAWHAGDLALARGYASRFLEAASSYR